MLIATAGHIDHGKSALIRALTGVETDRLPEERARGISIDLGFAYWRPDETGMIGFVDVPGHERYIDNMLAGVSGVDFALLVIAADDGIMPQTREHLHILDLLGIARGIVAITKCDRVAPGQVSALRAEVQDLLAPTTLAAAPILGVSATTGAGIGELAAELLAARVASRSADRRQFRLAIDRVFTVTGAGTVVTGTVHAGSLCSGEVVVVSPGGIETRVRGMQSAGVKVEAVAAGERCALNLAGLEVEQLHRGDWLVAPAMHAPSQRIAARVKVLAGRTSPLRHNSRLHLHHGTGVVAARVLSPRQQPIAPGTTQLVQFSLDQPISTMTAERFVLRDPSGRELIGGGAVIDPWAPEDRRTRAGHATVCAALEQDGPAESLAALLAIDGFEVDTAWFERCFNLTADAARQLYGDNNAKLLGPMRTIALPGARYIALAEGLLALLGATHREHPELGGLTARDLRAGLPHPVSDAAWAALLRDLTESRRIDMSTPLVRLPGHTASFTPAEAALWRGALDWLEARGAKPVDVATLSGELHCTDAAVRAMLYRRRGNGDVWAVTDSKFMLREHVAALAASAAELAGRAGGEFTAAQYRDATGIGRNFVIQLLEFFDRIGVTARRGSARVVRSDYAAVTGASAPYSSTEASA
jgi:selenocysteine-specific elongation factor